MNFIQGHALLRTKCHKPLSAPISEVIIADFCEMILENEHILTDDQGLIKTFQCTKGDRQFKGIVKYKTGERNFDYSLCPVDEGNVKYGSVDYESKVKYGSVDHESKVDYSTCPGGTDNFDYSNNVDYSYCPGDDCHILIGDKPYYILRTPSDHPTTQIHFSENQLVITKDCSYTKKECSNNTHSIESVEVVKVGLKASSLLESIICNLPMFCSSHPTLSYFCFSSVETFFGFTFSFYKDGYHFYSVVLLSAFYNPLDLFDKPLEKLEDVLLFENDCFLISEGGVEIYLSSRLQIDFDFPSDLINKVIGSILCEERMCFISTQDVLLKIMYFLRYIEPFKWSHSLVITNNEKGDEMIVDSPLPFIFGKKKVCHKEVTDDCKETTDDCKETTDDCKETTDGYKETTGGYKETTGGYKETTGGYKQISGGYKQISDDCKHNNDDCKHNCSNNCVLVDLDNFIIKNSSIEIEATKDFTLRLATYVDSKKKFILEKYPDNIYNILLYSHRYLKEEGLVFICPEDSDYSFEFISRLTSTRMFIRYIVEERFSPVQYIYDIQTRRIELIPYVNIEDYTVLDVLKVYIMIYDLENNELTRRLVQLLYKGRTMLSDKDISILSNNFNDQLSLRTALLRRLSVCGDYSTISKIIKERPLTLSESHKINVYENQKMFKINWKDIKDFHLVNVCDFGDLNIKNMITTILNKSSMNKNNTSSPLKTVHSNLPHDKEKCKFKTMIIKESEIYNLYPLESLASVFLSLPHKSEHPEIFYNLVGYFLHFELPFNCETVDYVL